MLLSDSKAKQTSADYLSPLNSYSTKKQAQFCDQCGLSFDTVPQLLNHRKRFCQNSGYDNLTGLLMKETGRNDLKVDYKLNRKQSINKNNDTKMKKYGQYSLSKIKYDPTADELSNKRSLLLYDDMMGLEKHKHDLQSVRPYQIKPKFFQSNSDNKKELNPTYLSEKKQSHDFNNSKSTSSFSYRLNEQNLTEPKSTNADYLQSLLLKNHQSVSPASKFLVKDRKNILKRQFLQDTQQNPNIVHYKSNLASLDFAESLKKPTLLDRSNASIANMPLDQKLTYAKYKLDQLHQIKQLYLKNGGQSKQFKENVEKMIKFYEKLIADCQSSNLYQSRLSIASRPDTPIMKLNSLNNNINNNSSQKGQLNSKKQKIVHSQRNDITQNLSKNNQKQLPQFPFQFPLPSSNHPYLPSYPQLDPNSMILQNYAQMYQMKIMQQMLKSHSQQNRKLIEVLIQGLGKEKYPDSIKKNTHQNIQQQSQQETYRFSNEVNTIKSSQDRILKLLQQEQTDEMKLISKLPVGLQDEKLLSLIKNSQLRFKMEKEVLKQKLERLSWQEKVQSLQEERQLKNNEWIGAKNKDVIATQMNQYLHDFQDEFRPYQYQ